MSDFLTLEEQRNRLLDYDWNHWKGRMHQSLADMDITTRHVQRADDLEILHVDFGNPDDTINSWWQVIEDKYPNTFRSEDIKLDPANLQVALGAAHYREGVHRVRINLVSFWESHHGSWNPKYSRLPDDVIDQADAQNKTLAQAEVLSLFGVHRELALRLNGKDLPKLDMLGYKANNVDQSKPWQGVLCIGYDDDRHRLEMSVRMLDRPVFGWGAPTIID